MYSWLEEVCSSVGTDCNTRFDSSLQTDSSLLLNGYRNIFPGKSSEGLKLTTRFYLAWRSRMVELVMYVHKFTFI
jgi:hypothetical protein